MRRMFVMILFQNVFAINLNANYQTIILGLCTKIYNRKLNQTVSIYFENMLQNVYTSNTIIWVLHAQLNVILGSSAH